MALQMNCSCGTRFLVDARYAGKSVQCPDCNNSLQVPLDRGGQTEAPHPVLVEPVPDEPDDALLEFSCKECGNSMKARSKYAGLTTRCPRCEASVTIPGGPSTDRPAPKKSKVGLFAILGLLAGLLIVGAVLFVLWQKDKLNRGLPGQMAEINDLSLVPANAQALLCLKLGTIWQVPAVAKAIRDRRDGNPNQPDIGQRLESETGLKPDIIERITYVITDVGKKEGWTVIKTKQPYDSNALLARIRKPRQSSHRDRPYVVGENPEGQPIAVAALSTRVLVTGNEPGVRQALGLIGSPIDKGPLAPVIALCDKEHHAVTGYNPATGSLPNLPPGIDVAALADVEVVLGTMNLREEAEVEMRARTASKDKAERVHGKVNSQIKLLQGGFFLSQFMRTEKGNRAQQWSKLLSAIKLGVEDNDVVGMLKTDSDIVVPLLLGVVEQQR